MWIHDGRHGRRNRWHTYNSCWGGGCCFYAAIVLVAARETLHSERGCRFLHNNPLWSWAINAQLLTVYPKKYAHGFCFAVLCCGYTLIFPYPSGLLHWHCGNLTIAPVPGKQPWWIWINTSCEFIMHDCITTTKPSTTKPCAYFLGYTVLWSWILGTYMSMGLCEKDVTPLLTHWSYVFLALTHRCFNGSSTTHKR